MTPRDRASMTTGTRVCISVAFVALGAGVIAWMFTSDWRIAASGAVVFLLGLVCAAMATGQ